MRLFIAINLSEEAKQEIENLKQEFIGIKGLKLVDKNNIHITLKFLGEVDEEKAQKIVSALGKVDFNPFRLSLDRIGCFPDEKRIKVLWAGAEPTEPIMELKKAIDKELPEFKDDHEFSSHITFARVKFLMPEDKKKIVEILANKQVEKKDFNIEKFVLYKSVLTPQGPVYEVLNEF